MPNEKPDSFQCGPFEVARNPDVRGFVEKLNRLREAVDSCRVQPGAGYTVNRSTNGTTLSIKPGGASAAIETFVPFAVSIRKKNNQTEFFVSKKGSYVLNIPSTSTPIFDKIDGLDTWTQASTPQGQVLLSCAYDEDLRIDGRMSVQAVPEVPGFTEGKAFLILAFYGPQGVTQMVRQTPIITAASASGVPILILI